MGAAPLDNGRPKLIQIGTAAELTDSPQAVEIGGAPYFLVRNERGYRLLSRICPHKGGIVEVAGEAFECPRHGWRFEQRNGGCLTGSVRGLSGYEVLERDGALYACLPESAVESDRRRAAPTAPLTFQLHAHACLELRHRGFSLLTDPWLAGPAFFGSWLPYPAPRVDPARLRPDAIWITHEHSDHFHPPTLELLPKSTPVYVPDFPNRRLPRLLAELGFADVRTVPFGEPTDPGGGFTITCFEPASLWNDSILLVEVAGFKYLNLNDAGVNHRIARHVSPVDLISSTFSPGASGYPLTWQHLSDVEKLSIMERSRQGSLDMLHDATRVYGAHFVLPFASFFSLAHPEHRRFLEMFRKNAPADVVNSFEETPVEVLDLLPGEVWNAANGKRTRLDYEDREHIFAPKRMQDYAVAHWDKEMFRAHFPAPLGLPQEQIESYFLRLNETPELAFCEDLTCVVRGVAKDGPSSETSFHVLAGRLELLSAAPTSPNVSIELPLPLLERIVSDDLSWDEVLIGYWCRLTRSPDVYHAGFWRLLQAPYYRRVAALTAPASARLGPDATIAEVLEVHGDDADRILRRYGLYCLGCAHSPSETLRHGAEKHGLGEPELERLVAELSKAVLGPVAAGAQG